MRGPFGGQKSEGFKIMVESLMITNAQWERQTIPVRIEECKGDLSRYQKREKGNGRSMLSKIFFSPS